MFFQLLSSFAVDYYENVRCLRRGQYEPRRHEIRMISRNDSTRLSSICDEMARKKIVKKCIGVIVGLYYNDMDAPLNRQLYIFLQI